MTVGLLLLSAGVSHAECRKAHRNFRFNLGDELSLKWSVSPGGVCTLGFSGRQFALFAIEFPTRPRHGVVGREARYRLAYKAASNYRGPDRFVIRLVGKQHGARDGHDQCERDRRMSRGPI